MAKRCATIEEFVTLLPEFKNYGAESQATLVVNVPVAAGAVLTVTKDRDDLPTASTLTEGVEWSATGVGADDAAAIAAAYNAQSPQVLAASSVGATVYVETLTTGWVSEYAVESSDASLAWSAARLDGGSAQLQWALDCTCSMINLECWGDKASCAHAYLAAHFIAVASGGESGIVERKKIDKLEIQYAVASFDGLDGSFASTKWGRLYLAMKKTLFIAPIAGRRFLVCL